jgi:hypothetical protein
MIVVLKTKKPPKTFNKQLSNPTTSINLLPPIRICIVSMQKNEAAHGKPLKLGSKGKQQIH